MLVPHNRDHLECLIEQAITDHGPTCSLNHIDIHGMDDLSFLFQKFPMFNGNISEWDVSTVTSMTHMFYNSLFNGDISQWDVSQVDSMRDIFNDSRFNGDISHWDMRAVTGTQRMFKNSVFNGDISQ